MKSSSPGIFIFLLILSALSHADQSGQWEVITNLSPSQQQSDLALLQCLETAFKNSPEFIADSSNSRSTLLAIANPGDEAIMRARFQTEIDRLLSAPLGVGEQGAGGKSALPLKSLTCLTYYHTKIRGH
jgi:hypothetical protein